MENIGPNLQNSVWRMLNELENKKGINEIMINSPTAVFVEREGKMLQLAAEINETDIGLFIADVATINNRRCDFENPILDGNLPDGSRINVVMPPFAKKYPVITIRKYIQSLKDFDANPGIFNLTPEMIQFFKALVKIKANIIVAGGTSAGKTTFLNLLLAELDHRERVIAIEDTLELSLRSPNIIRLEVGARIQKTESRLTAADLVKNSLRMRPDRIIIGEVRGGEVFDLLQAMNTGHAGSMSSIHANSAGEVTGRMENLFLLAGFDFPYHAVRRQISSAVNFIIHLSKNRQSERVVNQVIEITGMERDVILTQRVIDLNDEGHPFFTGLVPSIGRRLIEEGELPKDFFAKMP